LPENTAREILIIEQAAEKARRLKDFPSNGDEEWKPMQVRVARHTNRLAEIVRFYRDGLGLREIGHFKDHDGYDGIFLALTGTETHLEFTTGGEHRGPTPHLDSLLVLYLGNVDAVSEACERVGAQPVEPANPYWKEHGVTLVDPDGFHVVLVPDSWVAG